MNNMMLFTSSWKNTKTFKLIPTSADCPFVECIFDPQVKVLAIIGKNKKDQFHLIPKLDLNGDPEPRKNPRSADKMVKEERRTLETYQEYYLEERPEIEAFLNHFAFNSDAYDFKKYFETEVTE
jgi:hypothetical protein